MGFFSFLNQWWNFPYLVMLGLVAVYFVLQLIGILGEVGDHDHDHDHDHDADHHGFGLSTVLDFLGVGRVPLMAIWVTLFIFTGFTGLILNRIYFVKAGGVYAGWFFVASFAASLVVGLAGMRLCAGIVGKLVDTGGKGASSKQELCGKLGVVASARLDEGFGEVRVSDPRGNEMIVHARIGKGEAALARGAQVVLIEYDDKKDLFWATASPAEAESQG